MKITSRLSLFVASLLCIATCGWAAQPIIYPAQGQDAAQQEKDEGECFVWARNQTGFDPLAQTTVQAPDVQQQQGGALRGAAGGAAIGAIVGDSDDAAKGAAIGAVVGRSRQNRRNQLSETGNQSETLISNQTSDDQVSKSISKSITVNVSLSSHLVQDTNPTDTLFIFARSIDGPRMPIAVVRKQMSDLPLTVVLDDSASMMEQRRLSRFDKVVVGARISRTGDAMPLQGDLIGKNITVDMMQTGSVKILIDQKVSLIP